MKSVLIGSLAAVVIAIAAGAILENINKSAAQKYSTDNVRVY